jgi:RNA-splicing ligase RtcB
LHAGALFNIEVVTASFAGVLHCCGAPVLQLLSHLLQQGIAVRIATKKLAAEEAPESCKDVSQVGPAAFWFR